MSGVVFFEFGSFALLLISVKQIRNVFFYYVDPDPNLEKKRIVAYGSLDPRACIFL